MTLVWATLERCLDLGKKPDGLFLVEAMACKTSLLVRPARPGDPGCIQAVGALTKRTGSPVIGWRPPPFDFVRANGSPATAPWFRPGPLRLFAAGAGAAEGAGLAAPAPTTSFPATSAGNQLRMVARLIAAAGSLGLKRQLFFVQLGGWDTHAAQLSATDLPLVLPNLGRFARPNLGFMTA